MRFTHMADASAAEWLGDNKIVVANDEDNILRVYDISAGGPPVQTWDVSPFMELVGKSEEIDIEGSAKIGDVIYWVASHAPNKNAKPRPNRRRFWATQVRLHNGSATFIMYGKALTTLLDELDRDIRYAPFKLAQAALKAPKTPGSLNIEALCDRPDGSLLLGFRSPLPDGRALLATLLNPAETVCGAKPAWGAPLLLNLKGLGIRSMIRIDDKAYLITAGSALKNQQTLFFMWDGADTLTELPALGAGLPPDATPESLVLYEEHGTTSLLILSDDGTLKVDGRPAKEHPNPELRTFRCFKTILEGQAPAIPGQPTRKVLDEF